MIIISAVVGLLLGTILAYFILKSSTVERTAHEELGQKFIKTQADLENFSLKNSELQELLLAEKRQAVQITAAHYEQSQKIAVISAEYQALNSRYSEQTKINSGLMSQIELLGNEKQALYTKNAELKAQNGALTNALDSQTAELARLQQEAKLQFENLANKILEEKSEKFTALNHNNLKSILEPFQQNLTDLTLKVSETYDKESKERFSLGEKVKELALLNQQISDDAKKLTRALKGESKTQGNWGEMILESILEKSGLVKGREYFLEHELRDEDNKALFSEFSGKKMRPDAVVKYPDHRNVIIDSKVSLSAFTELVDESDPEAYNIKHMQHLASVKNHITQLSQKAYDDYGKSLDFVMMFIPSEPAYIAAMQADGELWNFAYEKRILLLNPSNLITSLKLIADLWKREHQSRNAMQIAERGAKLYDKFVSFVENLEKVGKNIDQARNVYNDAYKQLTAGNDNLVIQTQKLKALGIKNKKQLPQTMVENAQAIPDLYDPENNMKTHD